MTLESSLEALLDPDVNLTSQQLVGLSNMEPEEAQQLAEAWQDIPAARRLSVLAQLVELAADNVELNFDAVFKGVLADEDSQVRLAAVQGLHEYEARDLIEFLPDLLRNDPDAEVRREAAIALGRYALAAELGYLREGDIDVIKDILLEATEDLEEDEHVRARAIEALGAISGEETENLIESIYHEDSLWLKIGAVDAMGRSCNELWLPTVVLEMESRSPEMRHAAAFAAGEIGEEEAIEPLKRLAIVDQDREVQLAAVHALGEIGGPMARVALKSLLYEGADELREAIQEAITELAFQDDPLNPGI